MRVRMKRVLVTLAVAVLTAVSSPAAPAGAAGFVPLSGAGSTWSENALETWAAQVAANGIKISYSGTGSTAGRQAFENRTVDFAISEIPYGVKDGGVVDPGPNKNQLKYAYIPIVAGGTSFMYHLDVGGKRVVNLRMDGQTMAKIFTGVITQWNDPQIQGQNPGIRLPGKKIIPVVRSDGSGTSAQFTLWLSKQYPDIWDAYCQKLKLTQPPAPAKPSPCGLFSFFPVPTGASNYQALSGSTNVAGYVAQSYGEGAITYVEYSYAQFEKYPVVRLANDGGYYSLPTDYNVAVALQHARIDPATLEQILDGVYTSPEPQAYPLSSYSYMILPLQTDAQFTADKGRTLGEFAYYFLCQGQQYAGKLGYSPLPVNLVSSAFNIVKQVPGAALGSRTTDYSTCHNPTFDPQGGNNLAKIAPVPLPCDRVGGGTQCTGTEVAAPPRGNPAGGGSAGTTSGGTTTGGTAGTTAGTTGGTTAGTTAGTASGGAATGGPSASVSIDPDTGKAVVVGGTSGGGAEPVANPLTIGSGITGTVQQVLMAVAAVLLLALALVPPLLSRRLAQGRSGGGGGGSGGAAFFAGPNGPGGPGAPGGPGGRGGFGGFGRGKGKNPGGGPGPMSGPMSGPLGGSALSSAAAGGAIGGAAGAAASDPDTADADGSADPDAETTVAHVRAADAGLDDTAVLDADTAPDTTALDEPESP